MSDLNLTVQEGDDVYLSITETPAVVTLSQAVISGALASTVTVANFPAAQVVTGTVALDASSLAALESITVTVGNIQIGSSVSVSNFPVSQVVSVSNLPATQPVSGTVTANVFGWDGGNFEPLRLGVYSVGSGQDETRGALEVTGIDGSPLPVSGTVEVSGSVTASISNAITVSQFFTVVTSANISIPFTTGVTSSAFQTGTNCDFVVIKIDSAVSGVTAPSVVINYGSSAGTADNPSGNRYGGFYRAWNDTEKSVFSLNSTNIYTAVTKSNKTLIFPCPDSENKYFWLNCISTGGSVPVGSVQFYSCRGLSPQVQTDIADGLMAAGKIPIAGNVWMSNSSITIGSLPVQLSTTTIGGSARLNVTLSSATTVGGTAPSYANLYGGSDGTNLRAISVDTSGRTVVTGSISVANLPSTQTVAGTVTANISGTVPVSGTFWQATQPVSLASIPASTVTVSSLPNVAGTVTANISGTVPVSGTFWQATQPVSLASLPSSTVTVGAMPGGTLTTRFGTPTTASTAFLTTAVTNTSRKYLLIQNVTTASNVITVGIGFTPTTTQGIQLAAGAGITFEASYIPTGAVWVLSSVTASNYTILEA